MSLAQKSRSSGCTAPNTLRGRRNKDKQSSDVESLGTETTLLSAMDDSKKGRRRGHRRHSSNRSLMSSASSPQSQLIANLWSSHSSLPLQHTTSGHKPTHKPPRRSRRHNGVSPIVSPLMTSPLMMTSKPKVRFPKNSPRGTRVWELEAHDEEGEVPRRNSRTTIVGISPDGLGAKVESKEEIRKKSQFLEAPDGLRVEDDGCPVGPPPVFQEERQDTGPPIREVCIVEKEHDLPCFLDMIIEVPVEEPIPQPPEKQLEPVKDPEPVEMPRKEQKKKQKKQSSKHMKEEPLHLDMVIEVRTVENKEERSHGTSTHQNVRDLASRLAKVKARQQQVKSRRHKVVVVDV